MCLYTNNNKVNKVRTKPVKCVKIVKRYIMEDGTPRYFSLFCGGACNVRPVEYKPGEITDMYDIIDNSKTGTIDTPYPEKCKRSIYSSINEGYSSEKFEVGAGLHSYDPKHNGWKETASWADEYFHKKQKHEDIMGVTVVGKTSKWYNVSVVIIECEIPIGASYIKGRHNAVGNDDEIGYVSDKLKTLRVFETVEEYEASKKIRT